MNLKRTLLTLSSASSSSLSVKLSLANSLEKARSSARLICTMDSPTWYYRLFMGAPGLRMMKRSLLHFCGVSPVRASPIGSVRFSTPARRESWLEDMRRLGARGV